MNMTNRPQRLEGSVALVTGAASGIGAAMCRRFAAEGASVVAFDWSDELDAIAAELGDAIAVCRGDVRSGEDVRRAVATARDEFGSLTTLCNNAGIAPVGDRIIDLDEATFDRCFEINVRGVFLGMKYGIPAMLDTAGGRGVVINTASVAGLNGLATASAYAASKGAVIQMTRSAALEFARVPVRINSICPGFTVTSILSTTSEALLAESNRGIEPEPINIDVAARVGSIPMERAGEPDDIAAMAAFLASSDAAFVTGATMVVDGGLSVQYAPIRPVSSTSGSEP